MTVDVLVPLVTPIDDDGTVCGKSIERLLNSVRHSATGYVPCLSSGEGWRLSQTQWEDMVAGVVAHAGAQVVIAGIERATTGEVVALARRAQGLGATGVMFSSPFGDDVSRRQAHEHFVAVHDAIDIDVYIYNESALSGNEAGIESLLDIAALPRVVGIKDSAPTPCTAADIQALRQCGVRYFIGWEHNLGIDASADGCVVSLANLEPALCRIGVACGNLAVKQRVDTLTSTYRLDEDDWSRHLKAELFSRGIISSPRSIAG